MAISDPEKMIILWIVFLFRVEFSPRRTQFKIRAIASL